MHTALWKLFRLRVRGSLRSVGNKVKSPRGAVLAVFTLLVFGMMLGPSVMMAVALGPTGMGRSVDSFREAIPVIMLALLVLNCVTSLGERALYFSPSDVDFLFPALFSRRQILVYKILGNVTAAAFVALVFPAGLLVYIRFWPAAVVGCFLAWLMVNGLTMCVQLAAQTVGERAFTRARRLLLAAVLGAAAAALGQAAAQGLDGPWQETLLRARHALAAEIVLAPFAVFAKIITAARLVPDTLGWVALGALLVAAVYILAIRLDANYLETAARVSRKVQDLKRRAMSGGSILAPQSGKLRSLRLRHPPWMGGVGPLVWRQAIQALRGSRVAIMLAAVVVVCAGLPIAFTARRQRRLTADLPRIVIGLSVYVTVLYSGAAPFGFRRDYERMDLLKSLPIRPQAMACGQTIVSVLALTFLQWSLFATTAIIMPAATTELLAAAILVLPCNWILCGTENFLFLLFPSPLMATGSEGFLKMGRTMLFMLAKSLVIAVCGGVAAVPAAIVYFMTRSMLAASLTGGLTLLLPSFGILLLVARAFERYDVSAHAADA